MQDTNNITVGIDIKSNKSSILYHFIIIFINLRQGENDLNDTLKLIFDHVYENMDMDRGEKILRSYQLTKVAGDQASSKEKKIQIDDMKSMCFLLNSDQKRYSILLKQVSDEDNVGLDEYPVTNTLVLYILICTEGGILRNQQ